MFLETPRFPTCPSFGYTAEPMYSVTHVETAGGNEQSNENWTQALHRYNVSLGLEVAAIAEAHEFYHAVGGTANRFRFKDFADYKSCRVNLDPTKDDQPLLDSTSASAGLFQLVKRYSATGDPFAPGALYKDRLIQKPVQGTILIADGGTLKTEGADYDIDYATGLVDLSFSPSGVLTWGGEFDVPVRFDSEFPTEITSTRVHNVQLMIKETRDIA